MRRFAIALTTLVVGLAVPGSALAAPPVGGTPTPTSTPTYSDTQGASMIQVDKVLTKLNALEDKLDASTTKLNALTVKLDATTAKLDAMALQTKGIYDTVYYLKGYVQGGIANILERVNVTCRVAGDGRDVVRAEAGWTSPIVWWC